MNIDTQYMITNICILSYSHIHHFIMCNTLCRALRLKSVYFLLISSIFTVAVVAGVNPYGFGAYLVPLILLVAVPTSALSIFISYSPAKNNDDTALGTTHSIHDENGKENLKKTHRQNENVCAAPTFYLDANKNISHEWNDIIPEMKNKKSVPGSDSSVNDDSTVKKKKKVVGDSGVTGMCVVSPVCGHVSHVSGAIGGSEDRTPDSSCVSNDDDEETKDKSYTEDSKNNNNNTDKCKKSIETDLIKANYEELPPASTWPDFPLLVRKAPASASYNVSQNKEKLEEYIKPIKIHHNTGFEQSVNSNTDGKFFLPVFTFDFILLYMLHNFILFVAI